MHIGPRSIVALRALLLLTAAACASVRHVSPTQARALAGDYTFSGGAWAAGVEGQLTLDSSGTASMTVFTSTSTAQVATPRSCFLKRLDVLADRLWLRCGGLEMRVALDSVALSPEAEIRVAAPDVRFTTAPLACDTDVLGHPRCLSANVIPAGTGTRQFEGHVLVQRVASAKPD